MPQRGHRALALGQSNVLPIFSPSCDVPHILPFALERFPGVRDAVPAGTAVRVIACASYASRGTQQGAGPVLSCQRAGGMGLISGRKAFQRPMDEGVELLNAIQDVYLDPSVTIA